MFEIDRLSVFLILYYYYARNKKYARVTKCQKKANIIKVLKESFLQVRIYIYIYNTSLEVLIIIHFLAC
jgi:hypothetical protein